jgi:predicted amidohydrolase YtcJ
VRIEHGDGVAGDLIPCAKKLGVIIAENPIHFAGDLNLRRFGPSGPQFGYPLARSFAPESR